MDCWRGYLSGPRCRLFAYGPADANAIPKLNHLLLHLKCGKVFAFPVLAYLGDIKEAVPPAKVG